MERQDRIVFARQVCLQNLNGGLGLYKTEQEKQENSMQDLPLSDREGQGSHNFVIRSIIAILFFLFLLGIKQNIYTFEKVDCDRLADAMQDNQVIVQMEKTVEAMMAENE